MLNVASNEVEIRLGGIGGQGIALAGRLLGEAAAIFDGKEAVFTQTHGPEARGGASRADIIIANQPIAYPFVTHPDILAALFQEAYERFRPKLKAGGLLVVEADLVTLRAGDEGAVRLPATKIAVELGSKMAANIVLLGYLIETTGIVSGEAMEKAIHRSAGGRHLELNLRALAAGRSLATGEKVD